MKSKNINDSQFVVKLTDMMKEHNNIVGWSEDGSEIQFKDVDIFCEKILSSYFRHSNFNSFIRQLNIYSFYKTKSDENTMSFKNEIFRKGNQNNFFLIQRGRKYKDLQNFQSRFEKQCEQLISQLNSKNQLTSQTKETIISLLEYKYTSHVNLKRLKCEIEALTKQLKDSRNKKIQQQCKFLKSQLLASIKELNSESKKIDQFIQRNFLKQSEETKDSLQPILNQKQLNHPLSIPVDLNKKEIKNNFTVKQENIPTGHYAEYQLKQNLQSYQSFQYIFQEFKSKRQPYSFEPKIYLPFTSQNSFMILPSYIPAPSHIPFEGRLSFLHPSQSIQFEQNQQKNTNFYDFDEDSASMSFVKILPGEEGYQFPQVN